VIEIVIKPPVILPKVNSNPNGRIRLNFKSALDTPPSLK